jgi:hypothetical protein
MHGGPDKTGRASVRQLVLWLRRLFAVVPVCSRRFIVPALYCDSAESGGNNEKEGYADAGGAHGRGCCQAAAKFRCPG